MRRNPISKSNLKARSLCWILTACVRSHDFSLNSESKVVFRSRPSILKPEALAIVGLSLSFFSNHFAEVTQRPLQPPHPPIPSPPRKSGPPSTPTSKGVCSVSWPNWLSSCSSPKPNYPSTRRHPMLTRQNNLKIRPEHLDRQALIYIRQSTMIQVRDHTGSTTRQYDLAERALALGWPQERIRVIDQDQGHSGASAVGRDGFQLLVAEVGLKHAGAVLCV